VAFIIMAPLATRSFRATLKQFNPAICAARGIISYQKERQHQKQIIASLSMASLDLKQVHHFPGPEVHVCIIGESASRWHHGIYGYWRNTNPNISQRKDCTIFNNVITRYTHTAKAIPSILLLHGQHKDNDENPLEATGSLITTFKKAGYKTWWISNQDPAGIHDNISTAFAKMCDHYHFNQQAPRLDEDLIPLLDQALASRDSKKIIFIHLMGSHTHYKQRYPKGWNPFGSTTLLPGRSRDQTEIINQYDNSIAYTDTIVNKIFNRIAGTGTYASAIYLSDHGEDVYDVNNYFLHSEQFATAPVYEIPFIVWLSNKFKSNRPDITKSMQDWPSRPFMTSNFSISYLDLIGYQMASHDKGNSLFNQNFTKQPRMIGNLDYDTAIRPIANSKDILKRFLSVFHPDVRSRIWAHRVNSQEEARDTASTFPGVEMDVVFNPNTHRFDVNHPPAPSIGLDLETQLGAFSNSNTKIWLDMKGLDPNDAQNASKALLKALEQAKIQLSQIITESSSIRSLEPFRKNGFSTIWYTPTDLINSIKNKPRPSWSQKETAQIAQFHAELATHKITQISGPYNQIDFIQKEFHEIESFYTWDWGPGSFIESAEQCREVSNFLRLSPRIRCLLVRHPSAYNR
jgi:hypothetical protein